MLTMRSGSSELLLDQQQQQQQHDLRKRKIKELAPKKKVNPSTNPSYRSWRERISFYTTSTLAFFSVTAGASLLFLVPLYVDPAISTLVADFVEKPTLCITQRRDDMIGLFNCSWSSCREGCTSDLYKCTHIYVTFIPINSTFYTLNNLNYNNLSITELATSIMIGNNNYSNNFDLNNYERSDEAILLVNIKGCGYPPKVQCKNFTEYYGIPGMIYPCYYSQQNLSIAMTAYDRDSQVKMIVNYFVIPFVMTVISSIALCIMHCDCTCKKDRSHRRRTTLSQQYSNNQNHQQHQQHQQQPHPHDQQEQYEQHQQHYLQSGGLLPHASSFMSSSHHHNMQRPRLENLSDSSISTRVDMLTPAIEVYKPPL